MADNLASLFLIDPEVTFLNHGSFGACPRPVFEVYQEWQRRLERQPVAFLDPDRGYFAWMAETRQALAAEIGAEADDIVGAVNSTFALNVVARSLPLEPGDEILTTDHEYAALEKTWDYVARRSGARVVVVDLPMPLTSAEAFTEALRAGMTERTRVVFLSHITSPTALLLPIEAIVAEARARGIWSVIDGAHTPGHIPLDLDALGADFYAGNCHKWMMAPKGSAFLHVRREHQALMNPLVISHGWTADRTGTGPFGNSAFVDAMEMQGTRDPSAWLTVPAALRFREEHGWTEVAARCHELAWRTAERVAERTGVPLLCSEPFTAPQMVAMPLPAATPEPVALHRALLERHGVEIPVFSWKGLTIARLSVQGYNTEAQMERLIDALTDILHLSEAA